MTTNLDNPPLAPAVGSSGNFTAKAPFTLQADTIYTVIAVRTFSDMAAAGADPLAQVYAPVGLAQADYTNDVDAGALVVVLSSGTSQPVYIPTTYLDGVPSNDIVPYSTLVGSFVLGPLPDSIDVSELLAQIGQLIEASVGVSNPPVTLHAIPSTNVVTAAQDAAMTQARLAAISNNMSLYARLLKTQAALQDVTTRYNALVTWMAANVPGASDMPSGVI